MEGLVVAAAVVQALAAVVALLVTLRLARVARETLRANERMARSAEAQIAVMREQMELEYWPNITLALDDPAEFRYGVANVGKYPVGLQRVQVVINTHRFDRFVYVAIAPGQTLTVQFEDDPSVTKRSLRGEGKARVEFTYGSTGSRLWRLDYVRFEYTGSLATITDRGHIKPIQEAAQQA